jgi:hypothetical protein
MRKFFLAFTLGMSALLAGCGGGGDASASSESAVQALRAEALRAPTSSALSDANRLMDFAQQNFASLFAGTPTTGTLGGIMYRRYASGIYLGVVVDTQPDLQLGGVYVLGGPFSGLTYAGQLSAFITPTATTTTGGTTTGGTSTGTTKNLTVTVSVLGQTQTVVVGAVPIAGTQTDFCGALANDTTLKTLQQTYNAAVTINSCSFNGTVGNVGATISISGSTIPFSVVYTFS